MSLIVVWWNGSIYKELSMWFETGRWWITRVMKWQMMNCRVIKWQMISIVVWWNGMIGMNCCVKMKKCQMMNLLTQIKLSCDRYLPLLKCDEKSWFCPGWYHVFCIYVSKASAFRLQIANPLKWFSIQL